MLRQGEDARPADHYHFANTLNSPTHRRPNSGRQIRLLQCRRYNCSLSSWRPRFIVTALNSPSEDGFSHHGAPRASSSWDLHGRLRLLFLWSQGRWAFYCFYPLNFKWVTSIILLYSQEGGFKLTHLYLKPLWSYQPQTWDKPSDFYEGIPCKHGETPLGPSSPAFSRRVFSLVEKVGPRTGDSGLHPVFPSRGPPSGQYGLVLSNKNAKAHSFTLANLGDCLHATIC